MNKSLKVISSVALAGILALSAHTPKALAETSKFVGTYNGIAQFVLTDATEQATCRDIANSGRFTNITKFNGGAFNNDNTPLKTGQTFTADNKDYTVVVYGDVNQDGIVTSGDASDVLKYYAETKDLTSIQLEAANVDRTNMEVNSADASNILKFYAETMPTVISGNLPHDEEEIVEEDENFTITLEDNSEYLNNTNISDPQFKINVGTRLTADMNGLAIKIDGVKADGTAVSLTSSATVNFTTNLNEIVLDMDDAKKADIASIVGTVKVSLVDTTNANKVIRIARFENKNVTATNVAIGNIKTNRENSLEATISFEGAGTYDVKNVYYAIDTSTPASVADTNEKIEVTGNKVVNKEIKGITPAGASSPYTLKYLVEDIYGNRSAGTDTATILTPEAQANQVDKVNVTIDEDTSSALNINITAVDGSTNSAKCRVILYKGNKIIKEYGESANITTTKDLAPDLDGVGTYKVSVIALGNGSTSSDSEATDVEFEVKQLNPVSRLTIAENDAGDKLKVTWTKSSEENAGGYTINVYEVAADGTVGTTVVATKTVTDKDVETDERIAIPTDLAKDKAYIAKIVVNTNNVLAVNSEETTTSNQIAILDTSALAIADKGVITSNSITLTVSGRKTAIPNVSYRLIVYDDNDPNQTGVGTSTRFTNPRTINNPSIDATTGDLVVENLQPGKDYGFELIETIGNVENITSTINNAGILALSTKAQAPVVSGLTVANYVANSEASAYTKKIAVNGSDLYINGVKYTTGGDYDEELTMIKTIVGNLVAGDKLTIDDDTVKIELINNKNTTTDLDFGTALKGKNVIISDSTKSKKTIKTTASNDPTKVTLQGNGALYNVKGIATGDIEVDKGVANISANDSQKVTLLANASATVNGVLVSTKAGTTVTIDDTTKAVIVNVDESKTDSNLAFGNNGNISFETKDKTNKTTLGGTITINTTKDVTISSTGVAVDASINVISAKSIDTDGTTVLSSTINLVNNTGLNGTKSVTVNNGAKTVVEFVADKAINKMDNTALTTIGALKLTSRPDSTELGNWATLGLISSAVNGEYNQTEINAVVSQLNTLYKDVMDKGATLGVATSGTTTITTITTITFDGSATTSATISNIK